MEGGRDMLFLLFCSPQGFLYRPKRRPRRVKNRPRATQAATRNWLRRALEPGDAQEPSRFPPDRLWTISATILDHS